MDSCGCWVNSRCSEHQAQRDSRLVPGDTWTVSAPARASSPTPEFPNWERSHQYSQKKRSLLFSPEKLWGIFWKCIHLFSALSSSSPPSRTFSAQQQLSPHKVSVPFCCFYLTWSERKNGGLLFQGENDLSQLPRPWEGSVLGAATEPGQLEILTDEDSGKGTVLRAGLEQGINANEENEYLNKTFIKDRLTLSINSSLLFCCARVRSGCTKTSFGFSRVYLALYLEVQHPPRFYFVIKNEVHFLVLRSTNCYLNFLPLSICLQFPPHLQPFCVCPFV